MTTPDECGNCEQLKAAYAKLRSEREWCRTDRERLHNLCNKLRTSVGLAKAQARRASVGRDELLDDLGGTWEIGLDLDINPKLIRKWIRLREHTGVPKPVRTFHGLALYSKTDWRAWYRFWSVTRGKTHQITPWSQWPNYPLGTDAADTQPQP